MTDATVPTTAPPADRLAWADLARGAAMILVVFAHAVQLLGAYGWQLGFFDTANLYLTAIRMPLFFLISGVFAARAVQRSWPALFASRLALLIYVYLLWMLIRAVWFSFVPWPLTDTPPWLALALAPLWPTNGLWFLFALIVYLLIAKATARAPAWLVLVPFALVSVLAAADLVPTGDNPVWRSVMLYAFFFLLGARGAALWRRLAEAANPVTAVVALLVIPASMAVFSVLPGIFVGVGRVALSAVCVAACITIASVFSRWRAGSRPLVYVGRRTLAVYVVHAMLLALIVPLIPVDAVPAAVAIGVLTIVAVLLPLALLAWLGPLGGVFNLPHRLKSALAPMTAERAPRVVDD
jgi:uncharacterized membrane protein YcfT